MKKLVALLLCIVFAFSVPLCVNAEDSNNNEEYDYVDLLAKYTTKQVVEMFPEAAQYLADELRNFNEDISLREFNIDIKYIDSLYFSVLCENPDIFYVNPRFFESTMTNESNYLVAIRPIYFFSTKDIPNEIKKFEATCDTILKNVDNSWSDLIKIRYLHDLIATTCEYDMVYYNDNQIIYTAYGALINRDAVCEGYTLAYRYLLGKLGIETRYIISREMEHAWAMVKLDGKFYHVDITHDDPSYDNLGRVNHEFFLKSDSSFTADSDHRNWISDIKASDTTYDNAWWHNVNTFIFHIKGNDYYVNQTYGSSIYGALIERKQDNTTRLLAKITERWLHKDKTNGAFWERSFVYLAWDGEYLYYNDTKNVYRQKPDSDRAQVIYEKPASLDNDIYGLAFRNDSTLYITIKKYPDTSDVVYRLASLEPIKWVDPIQDDNPIYPDDNKPDDPTAPTSPSKNDKPTVLKTTSKETLYVNQTSKIKVSDKTAVFKSSDKKIATVSKNGKITAKKKGKTTITVKGKEINLKITVTVKNPKLKVNSKKIKKGNSYKIVVVGKYGAATYKSSKPKVATVTPAGTIKAKKKGKSTITVKIGTAKLTLKVTVN